MRILAPLLGAVLWVWTIIGVGIYRWLHHSEEATACAVLIGAGVVAAAIYGSAALVIQAADARSERGKG